MTNFLKLCACVLLTTVFFTQCKKETAPEKLQQQAVISGKNTAISPGDTHKLPPGSSCNVPPGFTSCTSDCLFSDCCVVWDPTKETGGCSCFFGVARCKTTAISAARTVVEGSTSSRTISFHHKKFEQFIAYCKTNNIAVGMLEASYRNYLWATGKNTLVNPGLYDLFVEDYVLFINSLDRIQLNLVKAYIGL